MLTPERMRRVLLLTTRDGGRSLIETLHDLKLVHIIDHRKGEAGLDIGRPLPEGSRASERLVRLRGLLRHLKAEEHEPSRTFAASAVDRDLDALLDRLEREVGAAVEQFARAEGAKGEKESEKAKLAPLAALPLPLEFYHGYTSLRVFAGHVDRDPSAEVANATGGAAEVFYADGIAAAFVPIEKGDAAQNALFAMGFKEIEVPAGAGSPAERLRALDGDISALTAEAAEAQARLLRLKAENADFLRAAEEHLAIEVEKAEAPLAFGATEHAFLVEAWIPEGDVDNVLARLKSVLGESLHTEFLEADAHGHGAQVDMHGADTAGHEPEKAEEVPPTRMRNSKFARPFEFFTSMFSVPRYGEIDPTLILSIAFPLFFGFMIGDLGLGLLMVGLGVLMAKKLRKIEGMRQLGIAIALAGTVAAATGAVVFQDAFGVPFGGPEHELEHVYQTLSPADQAAVAARSPNPAAPWLGMSCADLAHHAVTTWSCITTDSVAVTHPLIIKVLDVQTMLLVSLMAGLAHLALGLVFGIVNEIHHSVKHALAKVGWLILLGGFFIAAIWLLNKEMLGTFEPMALTVTGVATVVAAIVLVATEGFLAVLELPSMFANILSYLRLGAVAIAKGAMAAAFNGLTLVAAIEGLHGGGGVIVVLGLIGFVVAQVVLFVLGVLSSGIQAIRLNYVEFFTKFYKGGGQAFRPFGQPRQFTTQS